MGSTLGNDLHHNQNLNPVDQVHEGNHNVLNPHDRNFHLFPNLLQNLRSQDDLFLVEAAMISSANKSLG